ncbi:MAG: N-acetyl-gamma-glutamyl-phosphate reductase [Proteobacteria bacterium]|nr:N-acetyl-gamma-glutamyl-phosphate reductase [Pseudomonadota bacterium]
MIRAGIMGATGYVGIEITRLLHQHPKVKVTEVTSQGNAGKDIIEVYPHLTSKVDLTAHKIDTNRLIKNCDVIFISLPHGNAIKFSKIFLEAGKKVIDLGADFRLKNPAEYQFWYDNESAPPELLGQAIYGLPEITSKEAIANTNLLANPGCNATATILATAPALKNKIINPDECIFDIKLGISGGGRNEELKNHFCEISENIFPYHFGGRHRHTPEVEQELSLIAKKPIIIQFSPHLIPIIRGILVTACFKLLSPMTAQEVHALYAKAYENEPFIRMCPLGTVTKVKNVRATNFCDISVQVDVRTQRLLVLCVIDNLIKGGAGQAIQNMNIMFGLPQTTGLDQFISMYP